MMAMDMTIVKKRFKDYVEEKFGSLKIVEYK